MLDPVQHVRGVLSRGGPVQGFGQLEQPVTQTGYTGQDSHAVSRLAKLLIATALTEELAALTVHIGAERNAYVANVVMPQLDEARRALLLEDEDEVLGRFSDIVATFGGEPLFTTVAEFDAWMADQDSVLVLDGNWKDEDSCPKVGEAARSNPCLRPAGGQPRGRV